MIKIDIIKKIQNIIKKNNKIIFKISFMNNLTNLKFYNFFVDLRFWFHSRKNDYNLLVILLTFYVNLILKLIKKSKKIFIISKVIQNLKKTLNFSFFWQYLRQLKHFVFGVIKCRILLPFMLFLGKNSLSGIL